MLPRFSIRGLLTTIAICGGLFAVLPFAVRGHAWALAIAITVSAVLMIMLGRVSMFVVTWFAGLVVRTVRGAEAPASPFAEDTLPPQLIEPEEPV